MLPRRVQGSCGLLVLFVLPWLMVLLLARYHSDSQPHQHQLPPTKQTVYSKPLLQQLDAAAGGSTLRTQQQPVEAQRSPPPPPQPTPQQQHSPPHSPPHPLAPPPPHPLAPPLLLPSLHSVKKWARPTEQLAAITATLGLVFPFTGAAGSARARIVEASWTTLCRAMRAYPSLTVRIIVFDDSQKEMTSEGPAWFKQGKEACAPNLQTLIRRQGLGFVSGNIDAGFRWANDTGVDFLMNMDSDLLLIEGFFGAIMFDYAQAVPLCAANLPVVSGYSSQRHSRAYGSNYLFTAEAYNSYIHAAIAPVAIPCHAPLTEIDVITGRCVCGHHGATHGGTGKDSDSDTDCRPTKPWDDEVIGAHIQQVR